MENEIYQIYDRIFKRIFALSSLAIINLINALFGTNHLPDSPIVYLNKEFVAKNLDKRFADLFIQINGIVYHLEAQMTKAKNIVVRVFEYGYFHAMENREDDCILKFPEPTEEMWELLQNLILNDILGSIKANLEVGNITEDDAVGLTELTQELYSHLSQHYELLGGNQEMKELLEGAMELPLDKYRIQIDDLKKENERLKAKAEADKENIKAEAEADKEKIKAEAEAEIQMLKKQLADLKK